MKYCQLCRTEYPEHETICPKDGLRLVAHGHRDPWIGVRLKNVYELETLIGAGGVGRVYKATQSPLGRPVAVKIVEPTSDGTGMIKRFYREARMLAGVHHANVVTIHDAGNTEAGIFYLVMELLQGRSLAAYVPAGKGLSIPRAVEVFDQVCAGVGAAHSVGIVHRDLKPANIFVADQTGGGEIVKIMDFGLAKAVGEGATMLTRTGMFLGTPGYVAPELIGQSSSHADARSDIYAMGAILYFLLTGEEVQPAGTSQQILARQLMEKLELGGLASRGDLHPKMLRLLIEKAMALDPAARHESCAALLAAFRFATSAVRPAAPRPS